jgi:hypothetical protein
MIRELPRNRVPQAYPAGGKAARSPALDPPETRGKVALQLNGWPL